MGTIIEDSEFREGQAVWVARHGNREDFADPAWASTAARPHDPGLSADGVAQARELGQRLIGSGIRHIFASPFLRAVETASCIADALDLRVSIEHGVCEWLNPVWYSHSSLWLPAREMARSFPRVDVEYRGRIKPEFPEVDERLHCWPRAARAGKALAAERAGDILIVCHASPMMGVVYGLLGREAPLDCGLCSYAKLVWNGRSWALSANGSAAGNDEV